MPGCSSWPAPCLATAEFLGATEILETLAVRTDETASLAIRDGNDIVILLQAQSTAWLRVERPVGTRIPLHVSAMGKALLAFGSEPPAAAIRALRPLAQLTPRSITAPRDLERDLATRERGYAVVDEEQLVGLRSIAAPVLWPDGVARAAVGVAGPTARITDERIPEIGRIVAAAAGAIQLHSSLGRML